MLFESTQLNSRPDVILVSGGASLTAMLQASRSVPIVFIIVPDPVGSGFVDSFPVRLSRTDLDARHDAQDGRRLDRRGADLPPSPPAIW
jgi:hypothetical protein